MIFLFSIELFNLFNVILVSSSLVKGPEIHIARKSLPKSPKELRKWPEKKVN